MSYDKCLQIVKFMRIHKPIGFFLLLWPSLWGLWLANSGVPTDIVVLIMFVFGAVCMRSVGCMINDYIDRDIDCYISRTKNRPLPANKITVEEALIALLILFLLSVILVSNLNLNTILLSFFAFVLTIIYPYLKRYVYFPQIVLGILFSWPILMAFTATNHCITSSAWLLFLGNVVWVTSYDTIYAIMDKEDDQCIGLKSLAVLFKNMDRLIVGILQFFVILILGIIGWKEHMSLYFYVFSLFGPVILMIWQQYLIRERVPSKCFKAFLNNNYVGMLIFLGFVCNYL